MISIIRAKLTVTAVTEYNNNNGGKTVKLTCVYDPSIPEDRRFSQATPNGSMELHITNPAALEQFKTGKTFYVDFTEVEA
jgi:hypothetical protein